MKAYNQLLEVLSFYCITPNIVEKMYLQDLLNDYQSLIRENPFFKDYEISFKDIVEINEKGKSTILMVFENPADKYMIITKDGSLIPVKEILKNKKMKEFALKLNFKDLISSELVIYEDVFDNKSLI